MIYALSQYRRFLIWFVGLAISLPILLTGLQLLVGINLNSSATMIIPMMIAAQIQGAHFAETEGRLPKSGEAWQAARYMSVLGWLISVFLAAILLVINFDAISALLTLRGQLIAVVLLSLLFGLFLLLGRLFFGLGARQHFKVEAKKQARAAEEDSSE